MLAVNSNPNPALPENPEQPENPQDAKFRYQVYVQGTFEAQHLPKIMPAGGVQAGLQLGRRFGRDALSWGPVIQWSQARKENHGLLSQPKNYFSGVEFQWQRKVGLRWSFGAGVMAGLRVLDARKSELLLPQGVVVENYLGIAFEPQGFAQVGVTPSPRKPLKLFLRAQVGAPLYLTYQDNFGLRGLHWGLGLGISFDTFFKN